MPLVEDAKKMIERVTGLARPTPKQAKALVRRRVPQTFHFKDDGLTPNNPVLPLVYYRSAVTLNDAFDPAAIFEVLFAQHGWKQSWRDGIYGFLHFHTRTHEVLGIARGTASVRFGGRKGRKFHLKAGDVVILPAGTGHFRLSKSRDLLVVGAYPAGGKYDEPKPADAPEEARRLIAKIPLPKKDPVFGKTGALGRIWSKG